MNILGRTSVSLLRTFHYQNHRPHRGIYRSTTSSAQSIEVPTSSTTDEADIFPVTAECPPPMCACAEMPTSLNIEYKKPLQGTMPRYARHVVIRTAQDDWLSRIEDGYIEDGQGNQTNLARDLKELIGPKGKYFDPHSNILVTNSSLTNLGKVRGRDVSVYPEGYTVCDVGETPESVEDFIKQFLLPPRIDQADLECAGPYSVRIATCPTVLICGHNSRDSRCGTIGPLLRNEVNAWNYRHGKSDSEPEQGSQKIAQSMEDRYRVQTNHPYLKTDSVADVGSPVHVGLVSHIGGHAWAGNVIIYLPPDYRLEDGTISPFARKGVWYGRVQPKHVEGIMEETVRKGRVITQLLRGVHGGTIPN